MHERQVSTGADGAGAFERLLRRGRRLARPVVRRSRSAWWTIKRPWIARGRQQIAEWFQGPGKGTVPQADVAGRIASCVQSCCSPDSFDVMDRAVRVALRAAGDRDLVGRRVIVYGCDWGFSTLHLAEMWRPESLIGIDPTGRFGQAADSILREHSGARRFSGVRICTEVPPLDELHGTDYLLLTRGARLRDAPTGHRDLLEISRSLRPGGTLVVCPAAGPEWIAAGNYPAILSGFGFEDFAWHDASGRPARDGVGYFLAAVRSEHVPQPDSSVIVGLESPPDPVEEDDVEEIVAAPYEEAQWVERARVLIREWFETTRKTIVDPDEETQVAAQVEACLEAYCSESAFRSLDAAVGILLTAAAADSLENDSVLVFGSDWGFSVLHLAERWSPRSIVGVDLAGKYGDAARTLLEEGRTQAVGQVRLIDRGTWGLREFKATVDYLLVTNSLSLLDSAHDRLELFQVTETLRTGGIFLYVPRQELGMIRLLDYPAILTACGMEGVRILDPHGADVPADSPQAYLVLARKSIQVSRKEFEVRLAEVGQDSAALLARRPASVDPHGDLVGRIAAVRQQIEKGNSTLETLPLRYTLNVISVCNIKCIFCDYPDMLRHWTLPETFLGDVLDTIEGTHRIQITGGEPLLNSTAMRLVERVAEMPYTLLEIISNMTLPPKRETMETIARGASFLTCSIDAATKETYDRIRQNSDWDRVFDNLKLLAAIRKENGTKHPHIEINFIITGHNVHEIAAFMDRAREVSAGSVAYKWLYWTVTPRTREEDRVDTGDDGVMRLMCEQVREAHRRGLEYGIFVNWGPVPFHVKEERPDLYEEYDLDRVFNETDGSIYPYTAFDAAPRPGSKPPSGDIDEPMSEIVGRVDEMPDGLMGCTAPFTTLQVNHPQYANFCCYSTAPYRSVKIDSSGSLMDAWNAPEFVEARRHFLAGEYEKTCLPNCSIYAEYRRLKSEVEGASGEGTSGEGTSGPEAWEV